MIRIYGGEEVPVLTGISENPRIDRGPARSGEPRALPPAQAALWIAGRDPEGVGVSDLDAARPSPARAEVLAAGHVHVHRGASARVAEERRDLRGLPEVVRT